MWLREKESKCLHHSSHDCDHNYCLSKTQQIIKCNTVLKERILQKIFSPTNKPKYTPNTSKRVPSYTSWQTWKSYSLHNYKYLQTFDTIYTHNCINILNIYKFGVWLPKFLLVCLATHVPLNILCYIRILPLWKKKS